MSGADVGSGVLGALARRRELAAGALMALVGAGVISQGVKLRLGSLTNMGPGFFPVTLGLLLVLLGVIIAIAGRSGPPEGEEAVRLSLRGGACILLGVVAFIVLGEAFGFAAATFSAVFISAMGDRQATWRASAALAAGVTVCGGVVFTRLLSIPFPIFHWFGS